MHRVLIVFVFIIFSITFFASINNLFYNSVNDSKSSIENQIAVITLENPTASSSFSNSYLIKRTLILDENGMLQNRVLYEESNLNSDELETINSVLK